MRSLNLAIACSFAFFASAPAQGSRTAGASSELKSWQTPWDNTRPRDPYADQQVRVWFVGQVGNYVAHVDPKTGEFKKGVRILLEQVLVTVV